MKSSRRFFFSLILLAVGAPLLASFARSGNLAASVPTASEKGKYLFYVGTYTQDGTNSKGIYAYRFDSATGEITSLGLVAETTNPSFLALHPGGHFLYAVNELQNYQHANDGGVSAFSIDRATGKLTFLNEVESKG